MQGDPNHGALPYALGTMVETPAAAISGSEIVPALRAKVAGYDDDVHPVYGFASFGINDLTQTTLAISRDDVPIALRQPKPDR